MKEMYFTIAGCNHYYGSDFMEKGMKVKLVKEPDNEYDSEAIQVKIKGLGKVGYVANSPYTVKGESMSAGRLYDKIGGTVIFVSLFLPDIMLHISKRKTKKFIMQTQRFLIWGPVKSRQAAVIWLKYMTRKDVFVI